MKKHVGSLLVAMAVMGLASGCLNLSLGGGSKHESRTPTVGQQLIDLQRAKNAGAISEDQYQKEKAKLLHEKP